VLVLVVAGQGLLGDLFVHVENIWFDVAF
jgi:hypothetical protein